MEEEPNIGAGMFCSFAKSSRGATNPPEAENSAGSASV
jgi:hypothetical protein